MCIRDRLKAPLLVPSAVAGGLALAWGQEWKGWNNRAKACFGMVLGLAPGIGWHLWHAHIRGTRRSGFGVEMAPGGFCWMPAKAVTWAGGSP